MVANIVCKANHILDSVTTFQVNIGHLCNLNCRHCHVESGPTKVRENMDYKVSITKKEDCVINITADRNRLCGAAWTYCNKGW